MVKVPRRTESGDAPVWQGPRTPPSKRRGGGQTGATHQHPRERGSTRNHLTCPRWLNGGNLLNYTGAEMGPWSYGTDTPATSHEFRRPRPQEPGHHAGPDGAHDRRGPGRLSGARSPRRSELHDQDGAGHHAVSRRDGAGGRGRGHRPHRAGGPETGTARHGRIAVGARAIHAERQHQGPVRRRRAPPGVGRAASQGGRCTTRVAPRRGAVARRRRFRRRLRDFPRYPRRGLHLRRAASVRGVSATGAVARAGRGEGRSLRDAERVDLCRARPGPDGPARHPDQHHHQRAAAAERGGRRRPRGGRTRLRRHPADRRAADRRGLRVDSPGRCRV